MKLNTTLLVLFIFFQTGCKEEFLNKEDIPTITAIDSVMKVVWRIPKSKGMSGYSGFSCIYNSIVAFSVGGTCGENCTIIGLDKNTGKEIWRLHEIRYHAGYTYYQVDNLLIFSERKIVYAVNMLDGTIVWETKCPYDNVGYFGDGGLYLVGGRLWKSWSCGNNYTGDSTILFSIDPKNGSLERINSWDSRHNDLFQFNFTRPAIWMLPNSSSAIGKSNSSDSILILNSLSNNMNNNQNKGDFIAWNLNTDEIYFDFRAYNGFDFLINPIVIDNNVILFNGWQKLESINLLTLKTNWQLDLTGAKSTRSIMYHDGNLITSPGGYNGDPWLNGTISFINPENGHVSKTLKVPSIECHQLFFKDNWMYYSKGMINKVDLNKPAMLWEFESPYSSVNNSQFSGDMAFDAANDLIYIADYGNFYCLKINK